tara:strand:+ start:568 stop:798 length:231 start_codon:yes stop_codon:yes gene_type:complete
VLEPLKVICLIHEYQKKERIWKMTLKEKIAQSQQINQLKSEMSIYDDAIKSGSKFSDYYETKAAAIKAKLFQLNPT